MLFNASPPNSHVPLRHGGFITSVKGSVASAADVAFLFKTSGTHCSVSEVVHAGGVLADCLLARQNAQTIYNVFAPKAAGASNLWQHSGAIQPLSSTVAFSSVSARFGSTGQANYAAANAALDSLSARRQAMGQPAVSVQWGPWWGRVQI